MASGADLFSTRAQPSRASSRLPSRLRERVAGNHTDELSVPDAVTASLDARVASCRDRRNLRPIVSQNDDRFLLDVRTYYIRVDGKYCVAL